MFSKRSYKRHPMDHFALPRNRYSRSCHALETIFPPFRCHFTSSSRSWSKRNGLGKKPSIPTARHRSRSSAIASAVIATLARFHLLVGQNESRRWPPAPRRLLPSPQPVAQRPTSLEYISQPAEALPTLTPEEGGKRRPSLFLAVCSMYVCLVARISPPFGL